MTLLSLPNRAGDALINPSSRDADATSSRAASLVAGGIFISRILGLVRQRLFAHYLGDTFAADAYNVAVKIPNVVRNLLGEGTISASFIPVYSAMLERANERQARALAGAVLGILLAGVSILTLLGIALAPFITRAIAYGFDPAKQELTTRLVRVLFPMTGVMVISGWCLGIQNSHRRFFNSYASAALWSLAQIVLLLGWGSRATSLAQLAWWLAWATLAGAILQVAAQLPQVLSLVRPLRVSLDARADGVRETLRNFLPVVVALGVFQISALIDVEIASFLPEGANAQLSYAAMVYLLPVSLFGISVAASSLPELARESAAEAHAQLGSRVRNGWLRILFYIVPTSAGFILYGDLVVGLLYRSGRFGAPEQRIVHLVLAAYSIGLVSFASVKLLASAFYAMQDYRTPLRAAVTSILVAAAAAAGLALPGRQSPFAVAGIALGSALGSYVNLATLARGLSARIGRLLTPEVRAGGTRIVMATIAAAVVAAPIRLLTEEVDVALRACAVLPVYAIIFLLVAARLGSGEAARWLRRARLTRAS